MERIQNEPETSFIGYRNNSARTLRVGPVILGSLLFMVETLHRSAAAIQPYNDSCSCATTEPSRIGTIRVIVLQKGIQMPTYFYLVTTTGHGLFGAHYYAFTLGDALVVVGFIIATTVWLREAVPPPPLRV